MSEKHREFSLISYDFPNEFRASFITQLFSFLEYELRNICKYHSIKNGLDFSISEVNSGSDFDKAKQYLSNTAKIEPNKLNPEWGFIRNVGVIRNLLIHHAGKFSIEHKHFKCVNDFAKSNNLSIIAEDPLNNNTTYKLIIPNRKMPENTIIVFKKFIFKLFKLLEI